MAAILKKNLKQPEETQTFEKIKVETVTLDGIKIQKITAEPGWKWSEHLKPVFKTESCQKHHLIYVISGRLVSRMNDGKEVELSAGEIGVIPPGHDGWTAGDKPVVWLEIAHGD